jgi:hypothetical protein
LSDQNIRQTQPNGAIVDLHQKAGKTLWTEPSTHSGENIGDNVFEYIRVEIKPQRR